MLTNLNLIEKYYIIKNLLKLHFNKKISFGCKVRFIGPVSIKIKDKGRLVIGSKISLISGLMKNPLGRNIHSFIRIDEDALIEIGDNVGISNTCLWSKSKIKIGKNVKIGADCLIFDSDMHSLNYLQRRSPLRDSSNAKSKPIIISDDVFIGTRSIITKNVKIGRRSIIASGSVVTKSIPADEIWGGNPAKFIKKIVLGTMKFKKYFNNSNKLAIFLNYAYEKGVKQLHVSNEYSSYNLLKKV